MLARVAIFRLESNGLKMLANLQRVSASSYALVSRKFQSPRCFSMQSKQRIYTLYVDLFYSEKFSCYLFGKPRCFLLNYHCQTFHSGHVVV